MDESLELMKTMVKTENHVSSGLLAESEDSMAYIDDTDDEGIEDYNEKRKLIDKNQQEQVGLNWFFLGFNYLRRK